MWPKLLKTYLKNKVVQYVSGGIAVFLLGLMTWYNVSTRPPSSFPVNKTVIVSDGKTLSEIARDLKQDHVIRSSFWFTNLVLYFKHENKIVGGQYYFDKPLSVYEVSRRLTQGEYHMDQLKTTIPEGTSVEEIAAIVKKNYPSFDEHAFISLSS
jgi:cell division protein YceG involved in septum cleavage